MGPLVGDPLFLKHSTGDKSGSHLLVAFFPRLPPVRIVLAHDMDDVALPKVQTGLFTRLWKIKDNDLHRRWWTIYRVCRPAIGREHIFLRPATHNVSIQSGCKVEQGPDTNAILSGWPLTLGRDQLERDGSLGVLLHKLIESVVSFLLARIPDRKMRKWVSSVPGFPGHHWAFCQERRSHWPRSLRLLDGWDRIDPLLRRASPGRWQSFPFARPSWWWRPKMTRQVLKNWSNN